MSPVPANEPAPIAVGSFKCYRISDGDLLYPRAALAGDDPHRLGGFPEQVAVPYVPLLVDTGSIRILIDTGAGPLGPATGHLEANLERAGFQAREIDVVVLSHAHADHIGGLVVEGRKPRFANARIVMSWTEFGFWHSPELRNRLGSGSVYGDPALENAMAAWVERYLSPLRERLEWLPSNAEIAPGIVALDAPGHTPGHLAVSISSGTDSLVYTADLMVMPGQVAEPEWTTLFDLDAATLVATRRRLLDRLAAERSVVIHYHFSEAGRIGRRGTQFEWDPLA